LRLLRKIKPIPPLPEWERRLRFEDTIPMSIDVLPGESARVKRLSKTGTVRMLLQILKDEHLLAIVRKTLTVD